VWVGCYSLRREVHTIAFSPRILTAAAAAAAAGAKLALLLLAG
jgi:16S rRNA U1498 N3-methylase RsmE